MTTRIGSSSIAQRRVSTRRTTVLPCAVHSRVSVNREKPNHSVVIAVIIESVSVGPAHRFLGNVVPAYMKLYTFGCFLYDLATVDAMLIRIDGERGVQASSAVCCCPQRMMRIFSGSWPVDGNPTVLENM